MNDFFKLLEEAEKLYPNNDVLKVYRENYLKYDLKELLRNLKSAINKKTGVKQV
jgi:hypothetical protein